MIETAGYNISDTVLYHAKYRSTSTAFICADQHVSWADFDKRVSKVANALLAAGLQKGDKVSLLSLNSIPALEIMFGTLRAGAVIVPISALLSSVIRIFRAMRSVRFSSVSFVSPTGKNARKINETMRIFLFNY